MIRNHFKIAWRNLWKNKTVSVIHIIGLVTGMTCCLLMILYIQHELSYDKFQEKGDRIVRVIMEYGRDGDDVRKGNFTGTKVLSAFKNNFPEVENGVRMYKENTVVRTGDVVFEEDRFLYADSAFFDIFSSFPLLKGTSKKVLDAPHKVVLSATTARKYFGRADPVGQTIQVGADQTDYLVAGVAADCPSNSQIKFDLLASFSSRQAARTEETYWSANYTTYLLLNDRKAIASLQPKISPFMKREMAADEDNDGSYLTYELEPYTRVHLYSPYDGFEPNSNIQYLYISGCVALLILVIACFTYINLSTARSLERAREVGIRKVVGAYRQQVFWQFISESALLTSFALLLSIGLTLLLLPAFNSLTGKSLLFSDMLRPGILVSMLGILLCISFLAGSYPAFVLSGFKSVKVLKGSFHRSTSGHWLKGSLTVFQFGISAFLIIATLVMQSQLHYIRNKELGYDREHVLVFPLDGKITQKMDLIRKKLKQNPNVLAVSRAAELPTQIKGGYSMWTGTMTPEQSLMSFGNPIDEEYLEACGLQLIAGQGLSEQDMRDASYEDADKNYYHFILNQSAAAALGWTPEEAIGKKVNFNYRNGEVKGVIKDFHFASMHTSIKPLVLFPDTWGSNLIVKTSGHDLSGTISFLKDSWGKIITHRPFDYRFMDEAFDNLYASEMRMGKILGIFSTITILLACLGLFGLSAYTIKQRTREIGIRKVLGAPVTGIVRLLSVRFIKLVLLAFLIASPLAWWAMNSWLHDFVYRIDIQWWMFAITALAAVVIALVTVSFQSVRAAMLNPVKTLKTE
ncbi:ABC transporter permease [Sinomicrobium weinanense]|uniref:ABC transporter permease n=1 Tax=Sinomicrobium weinanense TaxID=2842200 RepID=A0A926JNV9_9FLAO|nr:ABC transporter permease [Sinomicrobium weinanense]MBC9794750.1 ABC transporter permease [Sinomicrobium weinanense]MBU3125009.1 ABC transporter permease [Sinomicrobium weinanense]